MKLEEKLEEHHATLAERVNALEKADAPGFGGSRSLCFFAGSSRSGGDDLYEDQR